MAERKVAAVGMAWYRRQDYRRILDIMEDAEKLPRSYDDWLKKAKAGEREMKRAGNVVVRAVIDPDEFVGWCLSRGLNVDAQARMMWGNEAAVRAIKGSH